MFGYGSKIEALCVEPKDFRKPYLLRLPKADNPFLESHDAKDVLSGGKRMQ
jgi:hypothetical protein